MKESRFTPVNLTVDNAVDAIELQEKIDGKFNAERYALTVDLIETNCATAASIDRAQNSFVVYENKKPVGYLGISYPVGDEILMIQTLGGFVTDPEC